MVDNKTVCRAKNPATCRVHGTTPGVSAHRNIKHITDLSEKDLNHFIADSNVEAIINLPLKKLSPTGLSLVLLHYCETLNINPTRVKESLVLAAEVHQNDTRSSRGAHQKTAYIEHPLRNTLRAIRCGVTDESTLIGSLLHDTVEDHPYELSEKNGVKTTDETIARQEAFKYIAKKFGRDTKTMVEGMSNPIIADKYTPAEVKNKIYANHVEQAIAEPRVFVGKSCDFIDNAVGLYHNVNSMDPKGVYKKAMKYSPVSDIFLNRIEMMKQNPANPIISPQGLKIIENQILAGKKSLAKLLKTYAPVPSKN